MILERETCARVALGRLQAFVPEASTKINFFCTVFNPKTPEELAETCIPFLYPSFVLLPSSFRLLQELGVLILRLQSFRASTDETNHLFYSSCSRNLEE